VPALHLQVTVIVPQAVENGLPQVSQGITHSPERRSQPQKDIVDNIFGQREVAAQGITEPDQTSPMSLIESVEAHRGDVQAS
jgi:hypothetical protein